MKLWSAWRSVEVGQSSPSLPAHTSLEVQEKPSVAEVEMSVVTILVHQLEELRVQNLPRKAKGSSALHMRPLLRLPFSIPTAFLLHLPPSFSLLCNPSTHYSRLSLQLPAPHH